MPLVLKGLRDARGMFYNTVAGKVTINPSPIESLLPVLKGLRDARGMLYYTIICLL